MTLLEFNRIIEGKYDPNKEEYKNRKNERCTTKEEFLRFISYLRINEQYRKGLNSTEDFEEFYAAYELFREDFPDDVKRDVFYAAKLNFYFEGVPCQLVYLLKKTIREHSTVNVALSALSQVNSNMFKKGYLREGLTILEIIENLMGKKVELITEYRRKACAREGVYEIYVSNTDRVVVVPQDIADMINSLEDLENVNYVKDVGVCVYDKPLRTMCGRVGICFDEYNLVESR